MLILALLAVPVELRAAPNDGFIWVNLSFKAIRNPADGSLPPYVSPAVVDEAVAHMNLMLARYGRGYRVRLAEPVRNIGLGTSNTDPSNPSRWYDWSLASTNWDFRADSYTNYPANYAWNFAALNLFMGVGIGGGYCGCPAIGGRRRPRLRMPLSMVRARALQGAFRPTPTSGRICSMRRVISSTSFTPTAGLSVTGTPWAVASRRLWGTMR